MDQRRKAPVTRRQRAAVLAVTALFLLAALAACWQFIKEKGISPLQFLNRTRINYAQKLLLSRNINNYKIYEIAEMCGFTDQLYFSRVFKKMTGVSPKAFAAPPEE